MPVIVIIETVSSVIRPATLAVRLAANMIAGHLLLALFGGQGSLSLRGATRLLAVLCATLNMSLAQPTILDLKLQHGIDIL